MELLEGDTLTQRIRAGPIPIDELLELGIQIADALDAAHARSESSTGTSNPRTFSSRRRGHVKILDFGLAKLSSCL